MSASTSNTLPEPAGQPVSFRIVSPRNRKCGKLTITPHRINRHKTKVIRLPIKTSGKPGVEEAMNVTYAG